MAGTPEWQELRSYIDNEVPADQIGAICKRLFKGTGAESTPQQMRTCIYQFVRATYPYKDARIGYRVSLDRLRGTWPTSATPSEDVGSVTQSPKPQETPTQPKRDDWANNPTDLNGAVAALASALDAARSAPSVDENAVRRIVADALKDVQMPIAKVVVTTNDEVTYTGEGLTHKCMPDLIKAASARMSDGFRPNIWLAGPTGSGKTHAAKQLSDVLGLGFEYNGALSMPHEVCGFIDANGTFQETSFYHGFTGANVYLFDEVDASENQPLLALSAALANGIANFANGKAERHPDSLILAGANTYGLGGTSDYVGRAKLDAAFLARFPVKIHWEYDEALELALSGNEDWARRVQKARKKANEAGLKVVVSPRDTMAGGALIAAGFTTDQAAQMTYLAALSADQRSMLGE